MSDFILSCCSTSDLDEKHYKDRDIRYVCFHYFLGDKEYPDDFGKSVPFKEFYARMAEGVMTRTSQVNEEKYTEYFESFLKAGKDVLHVTLSSGISGSYNSACLARDALAANLQKEPYCRAPAQLLGPAPASVARVNYSYRYQLTLVCKNSAAIRRLLSYVLAEFSRDRRNKGITALIDVNSYQ